MTDGEFWCGVIAAGALLMIILMGLLYSLGYEAGLKSRDRAATVRKVRGRRGE